jgi:hypothetical protein
LANSVTISLEYCYLSKRSAFFQPGVSVAFSIKVCVNCGEEFELKPDKPGFANRCPDCSLPEADDANQGSLSSDSRELNSARREAMRNLLYRKDS